MRARAGAGGRGSHRTEDTGIIDLSALLHLIVDQLLVPVIAALLLLALLIILDVGIAVGERFGGLDRLRDLGAARVEALARKRIARADLAARIGPSLGLMGTLIPLGPGIAALGQGDFRTLAIAITTAFDTTVLGLAIGVVAYLIGRWRRTAFERVLLSLETGEYKSHA
ncbi:MAG: MotA/TolQ/ExbB proton channel family protein [Pseudomonadota bacterium]